MIEAVIRMARCNQTHTQFGDRVVDIGPPTSNLPALTATQRLETAKQWNTLLEDGVLAKYVEQLDKEGFDDAEVRDHLDAQMCFHNKFVRKLNFDPLAVDLDVAVPGHREGENNGDTTTKEGNDKKLAAVKTVPIEVVALEYDLRRAGLLCMGLITIKALFLGNLKRTVSATDGAIELLKKQGAIIEDDDGGEDDLEGLSGGDVDGVD